MKCSTIFFQVFIIGLFVLFSAANAGSSPDPGFVEVNNCIYEQDGGLDAYGDCIDGDRVPSIPPSISYVPYSNENSISISWEASNGYNYDVTYELYERKNNETWREIYSGPRLSYSTPHSIKVRSEKEGVYEFQVRAKNAKGSSLYRTGSKMIRNPLHTINLYSQYGDILRYMDEKNSNYKSTSGNGINIVLNNNQTSPSERFFLGDGYDLIRGSLKEMCLNVEDEDFEIEKMPPTLGSEFEISYVQNNRRLAELLDVSSSATLGFDNVDFTLGLSGEKERYFRSVTDESQIRFVVKVKMRKELWKLNTPADAIDPKLVQGMLVPNDNNAKISFRERCGDNFISNVNLGSALYLVFHIDAKSYSTEEREAVTASLGASLRNVFSLSGTSESVEELQQTLSELRVTLRADQVGGPDGLAVLITLENVFEKYNEFIEHFATNTNSDNWGAVDFSTNNYVVPRVYSDYSHEEIFAKYTGNQGPLAQMQRWSDITVQHKERCDAWGVYDQDSPASCGTSQAEINIAMDLCRQTSEWENCIHPANYSTGGNLTLIGTGTLLLGWLSENVKKLHTEYKSEYYDHHVNKGGSLAVRDQTCLSSPDCFANKFYGTGVGIGKGFVMIEYEYDNPQSGDPLFTIGPPDHCLISSVYLQAGGGWFDDTTADWKYSINFRGLCPKADDFVVIP